MDPFGILNHLRAGVEWERADMPDDGRNESPGAWNSFAGWISGATEEGVQNKRDARAHAAGRRALRNSGYSREELGYKPGQNFTEGQVNSAIRNLQETKLEEKEEKAHERSLELPTKALNAQTEQARLTRETQSEQFRTQLQANQDQYAHQFKTQEARLGHQASESALDRALERDLSNNNKDMQMQIALMDAELADKRMQYDRETRRLDKRQQAIAQLMAGLGTLGGAFSL